MVLRLGRTFPRKVDLVFSYYSFLFALNGMSIPRKELEVLAYTSVYGTSARNRILEELDISRASYYNYVSALGKRGLLVRQGNLLRLHPSLKISLDKMPLLVGLTLKLEEDVV